jgi:hypothetical protein
MIELLLLIIFVEAVTEIITTSSIMSKFRNMLSYSDFLGELIHCGYCTSVWVAASVAWIDPLAVSNQFWINYVITLFVLHRLSNVLHELVEKWVGRRPVTLAIHKTEAVLLPDLGDNDERSEESGPESE